MSEFEEMVGRIQMNFNFVGFLKLMLLLVSPWLANKLGVDPRDHSPQRYFVGVIKSVLKHRRETGERQEDFLQMLMEVQKGVLKEENAKETLAVMHGSLEGADKELIGGSGARGFDDDDIAANCLLFLNAGFETVHSLVIWVSYVLAVEQQVQEKLRKEIKEKVGGNGGKLSYDLLHEMTYLDMVVNETLRYYSPAMRTERTCNKDYKVPGTDIVIEKDTLVILPIIGVHRDEKYYKNAEKFDPERFTAEEKAKRHPYSFLPFGHGPRNCIGMRFALTEAKMLIASLINDFKIEPCSKTDIPAEYSNTISVTVKPKNGMWLNVKALED